MKEFIFLIVILGLVIGGILLFMPHDMSPKGVADSMGFNNTQTNTTVSCNATTAVIVEATTTGRTSFRVSNNSTNTISICRSATCVAGTTGIILTPVPATGQIASYEQVDGYLGPYSCISSNGTTTLGVSFSL